MSYPHLAHERLQEPMSDHTTFHVGGPADVFVVPETIDELAGTIARLKAADVDFFVLGKGSDLLVSDEGYRGVVVALDALDAISTEGDLVLAEAGASLADVASSALSAGLGGFEFACGIPGSVGGACFMNAGAYGGCMADVLESVDVISWGGEMLRLGVDELELGYRTSRVRRERMVVTRARIRLHDEDPARIRATMDDLTRRREEKQPLEYGSAGSTFKRPEGHFAGRLIMDAGLKGYRVGDAAVSEKHAGFVVNLGHATASDVRAVIAHVQDEVWRQFGVRLEPEVRFLGFDGRHETRPGL